jgi:enamine deaminase RidA (YjgF/YER057c/UK114 family)
MHDGMTAGLLDALAFARSDPVLRNARLSPPDRAALDGTAWLRNATACSGQTGPVQWRDDGDWLFGHLDIDDTGLDLVEISRRAYLDIFAALEAAGGPRRVHPVRLWNYVPRINEQEHVDGMERYRLFNIGRQQAFVEAGHDAFEGAPAACALGTRGGGLAIRFLAARTAPVVLENPRQVPAYRYSAQFGPRSPTFSRAVLADAGAGRVALFVSGTASIVGEQSCHAGDVPAQLGETLRNLQTMFDTAQQRCTARFTPADFEAVVYVRHAEHLPAIRHGVEGWRGLSSHVAAPVYVEADICRSELLLEIEGHAFAPGVLTR